MRFESGYPGATRQLSFLVRCFCNSTQKKEVAFHIVQTLFAQDNGATLDLGEAIGNRKRSDVSV